MKRLVKIARLTKVGFVLLTALLLWAFPLSGQPYSKIEIDLPLIGFYPMSARPDAGLQPDLLVEQRVEDISRGIDTEMNALRLHLPEARRP